MTKSDDPDFELLQQRLEAIESGMALDDCLDGLPFAETQLLQLANNLRQIEMPILSASQVARQRRQLLATAVSHAHTPAPQPLWQRWLAAIQTRWQGLSPQLRLTAAVALPLLIAAIIWGWQTSQQSPAAPVAVVNTAVPATNIPPTTSPATAAANTNPAATATNPPTPARPSTDPALAFQPVDVTQIPANPETAVLQVQHGVAEIETETGWQPIYQAAALTTGQRIRTGKLGSATLTFHDGSQAQLGPDTEISLDTLDAQLPAEGFRTVILTQWYGRSQHTVQFRGDGGSRYEVNTPESTGLARGTIFQVVVNNNGLARYTVTEGRVDVTALNTTVVILAGQTSTIPAAAAPTTPRFIITGEGTLTEIGDTWTIGGQPFQITADTTIIGAPQVGDWVQVEGHLGPDGARIADQIWLVQRAVANQFSLTGIVSAITTESWVVSGQTIAITPETAVPPSATTGSRVHVSGLILNDGTLQATHITLLDDTSTQPFSFTGIVQAQESDAWLISGTAVAITADTTITGDIAIGDQVTVNGQILADDIWWAETITLMENDVAAFAFTGVVEAVDPWIIAGIAVETRTRTRIDAAVTVGTLVQVSGSIQPDGTWVAAAITLVPTPGLPRITLLGLVSSTDPWVVNGITLPVGDVTFISGNITVGDIVLVDILLGADGIWQVLAIRPFTTTAATGCFNVTSVVTSFTGDSITLAGWPTIILPAGVPIDGTIRANSVVSVQVCTSENGDLTVIIIIVIREIIIPTPTPPPADDDHDDDGSQAPPPAEEQVTLCHRPGGNPNNGQTITIGASAVPAHLAHGDTLGPCP